MVRTRRLLLLRELAPGATLDRLVAPLGRATSPQALGGDDRGSRIECPLDARLEKQRYLYHSHPRGRVTLERGSPGRDPLTHAREDRLLEPAELIRLIEDDLGDGSAVDLAAGEHRLSPALHKQVTYLVGSEQLVDDRVARERLRAEAVEGAKRLGLAGADASGQADEEQLGRVWPLGFGLHLGLRLRLRLGLGLRRLSLRLGLRLGLGLRRLSLRLGLGLGLGVRPGFLA